MYVLLIVAVRWVIERIYVAKASWYKTIITFTILEALLIMYFYRAAGVVIDCRRLRLIAIVTLPLYSQIQVDFLFVESKIKIRLLRVVRIFMIFAGLRFVYIDTEIHAIFFPMVIIYIYTFRMCIENMGIFRRYLLVFFLFFLQYTSNHF